MEPQQPPPGSLIDKEHLVPGFSQQRVEQVEASLMQAFDGAGEMTQDQLDAFQQATRDAALGDYKGKKGDGGAAPMDTGSSAVPASAPAAPVISFDFSTPVFEVLPELHDTFEPRGVEPASKKKKKKKKKTKKKAKAKKARDSGSDDDSGSSCSFGFGRPRGLDRVLPGSDSDSSDSDDSDRKRKFGEIDDEDGGEGGPRKKQRVSLALDVNVALKAEPIAEFVDTYRFVTLNARQGSTKDRVDLLLRANCLGIFVACDPLLIEERERTLNIAVHRSTVTRADETRKDDDDDYKCGYIYDPKSTHQVDII